MTKKFEIMNVDCANCAAKMEEGIKKLSGVRDARVNFLTQKLILDAETDDFDTLMRLVVEVCQNVDADFEIKF